MSAFTSKIVLSSVVLLGLTSPAAPGESRLERDAPAQAPHATGPALIHVRTAGMAAVGDEMQRGLVGALLTHPRTREASARLIAAFAERWDQTVSPLAMMFTGQRPESLLALLQDPLTFAYLESGEDGTPRAVMAVDTSAHPGELLATLERLLPPAGTDSPPGTFDGRPLGLPMEQLHIQELGDRLVIATTRPLLDAVAADLAAGGPGLPQPADAVRRGLEGPLALQDELMHVAIDLERLLPVDPDLPHPSDYPFLGFALGASGAGDDMAVHLALREGSTTSAMVIDGMRPMNRVADVLQRIPARAQEVSGFHAAPREALENLAGGVEEILVKLREKLREAAVDSGEIDAAAIDWDTLVNAAWISPMEAYSFRVDPPRGALMADLIQLVPQAQLEPYVAWTELALESLDLELAELEVQGRVIRYISFVEGRFDGGEALKHLLSGRSFDDLPPFQQFAIGLPLVAAVGPVATVELDDGWALLANQPQALERYLSHYSHEPSMAQDAKTAADVRARLEGASLGGVFELGETTLATYNTLLQLAGPLAGPLGQAGIDVGRLPPAELFEDHLGRGFYRVDADAHGITLRSEALASSAAAVVVTGALTVGVVAGLAARESMAEAMAAEPALTEAKIAVVRDVLDRYRMHHNAYPDTLQVLLDASDKNLGDPYVASEEMLQDAWGQPLIYQLMSSRKYKLFSAGLEGL
jgi:hypothetical protein